MIVWGTTAVEVCQVGVDVARTSSPADDGSAAIASPNGAWCVVDRPDGRWLISTDDDLTMVRLAHRKDISDMLEAIDDQARWLVTGLTATRAIAAIDPYAALRDPIQLGVSRFTHLDPEGRSVTVIEGRQIRRTRLDTIAALRETFAR